MIYEYALDPSLVVDWAINAAGRVVGQFGMDQRRLLSDFPRDWEGQAVSEFYRRFGYDDTSLEFQNAQPTFEAYIQLLTDHTVKRNRTIDENKSWLDEAVTEHSSRPFHAIMASHTGDGSCTAVITPNVIDDIRDDRWYLPTIASARKTAAEIAQAVAPLLKVANKIALIDPYFDPSESRFLATFTEMMKIAFGSSRCIGAWPSVSIMTNVYQAHRPRDGEFTASQKANVAADLTHKAVQHLPAHLPKGAFIDFLCLENPPSGDAFHNRFVLTDVGGVIAPYGLDDVSGGAAHNARDDLQLMSKGIYEWRWKQYVEKRDISIIGNPVRVEGVA